MDAENRRKYEAKRQQKMTRIDRKDFLHHGYANKNGKITRSYTAQKLESHLSPMLFLNINKQAYDLQNRVALTVIISITTNP